MRAIFTLCIGFVLVSCVAVNAADKKDEMVKSEKVAAAEAGAEKSAAKKAPPAASGLSALVAEAIRNNQELRAVRQDEVIYSSRNHFEQRGYYPKLGGYWAYDSQSDVDGPGETKGQTDRTWRKSLGMQAEQMLWDFGETRHKIRKEYHTAEAYAQKAKLKETEIAYEVTESYWRVALLQGVVALRQKALGAAKREVNSISQRVKAKGARVADLRAAEAGQAQAEQDLLAAQNGLGIAKQRLLFYLGRDVDGAIGVSDSLTPAASSAAGQVNVEAHPDMRRVRAAQQAADSAARAAKGGRFPQFFLRGSMEDSTNEPGSNAGNLVPEGYNYRLGLAVKIPIGYQWVAASGKLQEARAKQEQLSAEAAALKGSIKLRVHNAQNQVAEAAKGVDVASKQHAAAKAKFDMVRDMHAAKNATQADLAQAEDDLAQAEIARLSALYDVKVAEAVLLREMGKVGQ